MNITDELKKEIGNAIAAYARILRKADLGISTPDFEELLKCQHSELVRKYQVLKEFYERI